ncbi:thioredoxin domain-containing protein [Solidesulfovibrio sp.]|uniref:thioredoxin domain-containing protein n=1 Tax=Solidesulfovibrio sp. TaxID=2910990 RepID=UPI00262BDD7D|nr:thioredoxin domain-containing protein [Solidesulfovibrio sp.]
MSRQANRLIHEPSPYLQQHAYNPVDWFPWGEGAFAEAKAQDKPIFLSIGYSTCHWCHVMERESFEDEDIAALMRATVVAVKVDREERPDLDTLYMTFCQALTGRGGWPLTVFLTPDGQPFFAGTYFPKESGFGRTGMRELLQRVHMAWKGNRQAVIGNAAQILSAVRDRVDGGEAGPGATPGEKDLAAARKELADMFDAANGGFGGAPKFPAPHNLLFLLREYRRTGDDECLRMVRATLAAMRRGGVFDQVGFGFHRYSTDARWFVPHFEKMLYDQALCAMAYVEAWQATGEADFRRTALEIFEYVRRDLTSPKGLFYSAEDADSEGVEGKFYVWTAAEIRAVLPEADAALFCDAYGIEEQGNYRDEATGAATGSNIPFVAEPPAETAARHGLSAGELAERLERCRPALLAARKKRVRPLCDDKVLADGNGLMIAALAKAARAFDDEELAGRARAAAEAVLARLGLADGRLLHRLRGDVAGVPGMLDDYACLAWGLLELYQTVFDPSFLRRAVEATRAMIAHFAGDDGGFFLTPDDGEELLLRQKTYFDAAVPSGNSVAFFVLTTLHRLTGEKAFMERAQGLGERFAERLTERPSAFSFFLCGLSQLLAPAAETTLAGDPDSPDTHALARALFDRYLPEVAVLLRPDGDDPEIVFLAPFSRYQLSVEGKAAAHVCRAGSCQPPTTDPAAMLELLGAK